MTLKRRGSISLLAYLALSQRAHAREVLASLLCGDTPDDQARKFVGNLLVDLHRQVGSYVVTGRGIVSFDSARPHTVDVFDFCETAMACDATSSLEELEAAIALYAGEFLEGVSHPMATGIWAWESTQREELTNRSMQLLRAHIDASVERAAWDRGIQSARRFLAQEPWHEETHRQLITMLARSGQRQAAIAQYLTCRRALHDEIGVAPSPGWVQCTQPLHPGSAAAGAGAGPDVDHGADGDYAGEQENFVLVLDSDFERVSVVPLHARGQLALRHDREVASQDVATNMKALAANNAEVESCEKIVVDQSVDVGVARAASPDLVLRSVAEDGVLDPCLLDAMGIVEAQLVAQADNRPVDSIRHLPTLILDHNVARKRRAAIANGVLHGDTVRLRCKTLNYCSAAWRWLGPTVSSACQENAAGTILSQDACNTSITASQLNPPRSSRPRRSARSTW